MDPLIAFGSIISFALLCGIFGNWLRLPKVTSYLLAGLLIGPSLLGFVPGDVLHHFAPITQLAMALVLFNLGAHFSIVFLTKIRKHIVPVALGDVVFTFTFVAGGLFLIGQDRVSALMLGCLAMATAPATTVLVFKELKSEGPVTELAQALVAVNNLTTIIAFEVLFLMFVNTGQPQHSLGGELVQTLLISFGGSLVVGIASGLVLSYASGVMSTASWVTLLIAVSALSLGICETYELSYMLAFLASGFVFVNTASENRTAVAESEKVTAILCVAFFAIHGAELRLDQFLQLGLVGAAYIVLRVLGKCLGIYLLAWWSHESKESQQWLGSTMLSQAGAAIALAGIAVSRDPVQFQGIQSVIVGSVVVFEVIGPILIRFSVLQAGETPMAYAVRHSSGTVGSQLSSMLWQLKISSGADPRPDVAPQEITIADLLRPKVKGIAQTADFEEIVSYIEHSHDNTFPVIDDEKRIVGLIRYPLLSQSLFDPRVGKLVRAVDLATPVSRVAYPDDPASVAFDFFKDSSDDCMPVVAREDDEPLLGVVRRADVRTILIRKRSKGGGDH